MTQQKKKKHPPPSPQHQDSPLDPAEFFVAAIRLTQHQGGDDYHRMLGGARRCLEAFTLPLPLTDLRLLHHTDRAEFIECVQEKFLGTYERTNVLVLPAFPAHAYSHALYWETYLDTLDNVIDTLNECAEKFTGTQRVSSRTLTDPLYATERFMHYFQHPHLPGYHGFLTRVQQDKKTPAMRAQTAPLLAAIATRLRDEYDTVRQQLDTTDTAQPQETNDD